MSQTNRFQWILPLIAVLTIAIAFAELSIRSARDRDRESNKSRVLALVHSMRLDLLAISEAQNSAMIAKNEKLLGEYIQEADAAVKGFQQAYSDLNNNPPDYMDRTLTTRVGEQFDAFHQVHKQLASMLEKNTNRRAYELATGPGLKRLQDMDSELHAWTDSLLKTSANAQLDIVQQAYEIRLSLLRIQNILIPHISEASDSEMDKLEAQIRAEELSIDKGMQRLSQEQVGRDKFLMVKSQLADFKELMAQIIRLSRENSNVRSEALAMKERRDSMLACDSTLLDLYNQIHSHEPVTIIPKGRL